MWQTNFGAPELAALQEMKVQPLGQVIGNCVLVPLLTGVRGDSGEIAAMSELQTKGWGEALTRLMERATAIGANGVLAVRIEQVEIAANPRTVQFVMQGTAVKDPRSYGAKPYVTNLLPSDLLALRRGGFLPKALAIGNCAWHQVAWRFTPKRSGPLQVWANEEISELTQGCYEARSVALQRMEEIGRREAGKGIVGVTVSNHVSGFVDPRGMNTSSVVCSFGAVGTVVSATVPEPSLNVWSTLPLSGGF